MLLQLLLCSILLVVNAELPRAENSVPTKRPTIYDDFWNYRLRNAPEFATSVGDYRFDDRLDAMSFGAYAKRLLGAKLFREKVQELRKEKPNDFDLKLLEGQFDQYISGMKHKSYLFPMNNLEGPHLDFPRLLTWMKQDTVEDYNKIFSRIRLFPKQVGESIALMRYGIKLGFTMHKISVVSLPQVFLRMATEPVEKSSVWKPFTKRPSTIGVKEWEVLVELAKILIKQKVQPSYRRLHVFMKQEYLKHTRPSIGASSLPGGAEYYAACLHFHTTTSLSAKEINTIGRNEVERITKRMIKVKDTTGFKGDLKAFKTFLRTDPRFNYSTGQEIIDNYRNKGAHAHKLLSKFFSVVPKAKYVIVPVPDEIAPSMSGAYYLAPPADGSRPGTFYINTYQPEQRKRYSATSTGLHEAEPGHHLQGALAIENGSKITYRRFMEDRKYYEAPASYPKNTAYVEGWGLYAEFLGEEMGVYGDPYDMFGRLSDEMLRATRLVVDTGMHALGMTKEEAIAYMFKYTALSEHDIESEVNRYITWPGQACGYKMGEIKIRELRSKAAQKLGDKFDLRAFNTMVASGGGMPLNFLEQLVDEWIKKYL